MMESNGSETEVASEIVKLLDLIILETSYVQYVYVCVLNTLPKF